MKSLKYKLMLAMLITSAVALSTIAIVSPYLLKKNFINMSKKVHYSIFINGIENFIQKNKIWGTIESAKEYYRQQGNKPPPLSKDMMYDATEDMYGKLESGRDLNLEDKKTNSSKPHKLPFRFGVVDYKGHALMEFSGYVAGDIVPSAVYKEGDPLRIRGRIVAYAFPDGPPKLTPKDRIYFDGLKEAIFYGIITAMGITLILGFFWGTHLTRSLRKLAHMAKSLKKGLRGQQVEIKSKDEIGILAQVFNETSLNLTKAHNDLEIAQKDALIAKENAEKARDSAENANRAKSVFLSNMSHELRTPLNAILGFSQIMSHHDNLNSEQKENLQIINRSGDHLLVLINDVLDMSKIEAGKIVLNENDFDLHLMLKDLGDLFRERTDNKKLELNIEHDPAVPKNICTDETKLRQVLINLVSNAVKNTEKGKVSVKVNSIDPSRLSFEIEDTGSGIPKDELGNVFDPFFQSKTGTGFKEGTGLGLPISRNFIKLMEGDINVSSEMGKGTIFKFNIKVKPGDEERINKGNEGPRVIGLEKDQPEIRVLIVDDNEVNRKVLVSLLTPPGFILAQAGSGQEAIEVYEKLKPHLVLMDLRMPGMDGLEAVRRIKKIEHPSVIISVSSSVLKENREKVIAAGCDDFIPKPFKESEIFDKIGKYLNIKYIYENADKKEMSESVKNFSEDDLRNRLASLPPELIGKLEEAAELADLEKLDNVIKDIAEKDTEIADALSGLVKDFKHDEILSLIK